MPVRQKIRRTQPDGAVGSRLERAMHLVPSARREDSVMRSERRAGASPCVEITLRPYLPKDLLGMTALDAICFTRDFLFGETLMEVLAESAQALTLIADAPGGEMAGFAIVHRRQEEKPNAAYLVTIDVDPALRRCGIASGLLRAIERVLLEDGVHCLELHVHTANTGAIRFYEEHGFKRTDRIAHFYGAGDRDAFLYAKGFLSSASGSATRRS